MLRGCQGRPPKETAGAAGAGAGDMGHAAAFEDKATQLFRGGQGRRIVWDVKKEGETYGFNTNQHDTFKSLNQWCTVKNRIKHQKLVGEATLELRSFNMEHH